jgi:hypothetical protein
VSVALDTMVLIWGGLRKVNPQKGTLSDHDAEMQRRSRILLRDLDEKKEIVIVPAVAVAELLCPIDPKEHGKFIAILTQRFFCPPFDIRAASLAAELWQYHRGLPPRISDTHNLHILPTISAIGTIDQRIRSRGREAA